MLKTYENREYKKAENKDCEKTTEEENEEDQKHISKTIIKEIKKLKLNPGDVLVFELPNRESPAVIQKLMAQLKIVFGGIQCVILTNGMKLKEVVERSRIIGIK